MKIPEIKKAVENFSITQLKKAEEDIINDKVPEIDLGGADEGENLTHSIAAIWILELMKLQNIDFNAALRQYTSKVRNSIN